MHTQLSPHPSCIGRIDAIPTIAAANAPAINVNAPKAAIHDIVDLTHATLLSFGSERHIYQHPLHDSLIIKVVNTRLTPAEPVKGRLAKWKSRFHRDGGYRVYKSEFNEYLCAVAQTQDSDRALPLAQIVGLVHTTLGLGVVCEKIRSFDGLSMAPTLRDIAYEHGLSPEIEAQLDQFFADLANAHIIVNDPSPRNIVIGINGRGQAGMFLIDGFGQKQAVPLLEWSHTMNRRRVMRKYDVMLTKLRRKVAEHRAQQASQALADLRESAQ